MVRAIPAPGTAEKSRKFFDDMNEWARAEGHAGLGYITQKGGELGGPIAKNHGEEATRKLIAELGLGPDDGLFFAAGKPDQAAKLAGAARTRVAEELGLIEEDAFKFCWIVDFPMYEYDEEAKKVDFSPQPLLDAAGRARGAGEQGPARHPRLPVRHRLQRRRAVLGRDPQPPPGHHVQGVRDRRLQRRPTSTPISPA